MTTPEAGRSRLVRRLKTIPVALVAFVVVTALIPVLIVIALGVDLVRWTVARRPWMAVRLLAFLWVYLSAQVGGLAWMLLSWLATGFGRAEDRLVRAAYRVQRLWARYLFAAVRLIFGISLRVEGSEHVAPGPAVYMPRHASLIDTLLPSVLITSPHGIRLRYVLKKELLVDPALDVGGNRLPNYFVDRSSRNVRAELEAITRLAHDLGPSDGVLIYPEGTRFRAERQARAVRRLAKTPGLAEMAEQMHNVHPPRPGGATALLDTRMDVVFMAHAGLDGFARVADVWRGALVRGTVAVRFWRVTGTSIPDGREERTDWLFREWLKMDAAVGELLASA